jgi:hypothetical protein
MFIIMIIIFLNELKNLTLSFLKINYLKDVADINLEKHCNNIYCEAETGRFNLAKNSFDLLLPNDNFNTKTYYYTILFIVVLLFIDLFYKFWKYNDRFVPYLSNVDGEYFITYLKAFPFILSFLVVFILTIMIVRRYAPTSSKGYKAYFNTDNDILPDEIDSYNINVILEQSKNIIVIFLVLYIICGFFSAIPSVPYISRIDGINYFYFAMAYIFIVLLCFYMMVNIINITMTFTDNDKPSLKILNLKNILQDTIKNFKFKVLSFDEFKNVLEQKIKKNDDIYEDNYLTVSSDDIKVFTYINNLIKGYYLAPDIKILDFGDTGEIIKLLKDDDSSRNNIDGFLKYKQSEKNYENTNFNILCKVIIKLLIDNVEYNINNKNNLFDELNKSKGSEYNENFTSLYKTYKKEYNKLKLVINLNKINNKYKKKFYEDDNNMLEFRKNFKDDFINVIDIYDESIKSSISNASLYENDYNLINSYVENDKNYTVDISYNSKNKFYENYFKISNGQNIQSEYNIGNYQIKNMEGLLSYIIMFIVISLILLLIVYNITTATITFDSYNIFTAEVISPLFILFIFILFIYIFINYNTKYNLHFINGVFDSSYKRDLTHLNNKIIPFIKIHDNVSGGNSYNYLENYIILNVITSIINGNLKLNFNKEFLNYKSDGLNINKDFEKNYEYIKTNGLYLKLYDEMETSIKNNLDRYQDILYNELQKNIDIDDSIYYFVANIEVSEKVKALFDNNKEIDIPPKEETSSSRTTRSSSGANCGSHDELLDKIAKLFKDYVEEKYSIDIDKSEILKILKYCFPEDKTNDENAQLYISTIKRYVSNSSTEYKKNLKEVLISYVNGDYDSKGIKNIRSLQDLGKDVKMAYFTLSVDEKDLINKYLKVNSEDIAFADKLNIFDENYKSGIITFLNQQDNIQSILVMILDTLSDIDYTNIIDLYRYLLSLLGKDDECFDFDDTAFFSIEPLKPEPPKKEYDSSLINMFFEEIIEKYKDNILNIILVCRHLFNHFNFSNKLDNLNNDIRYQISDSILKYFSFKFDDKGNICPYNFLININTDIDLQYFIKYLERNNVKSSTEQIINPSLDKIVKNFLIISAHTKYNYNLYKNINDSGKKLALEKNDYDKLKDRLVRLYTLFKNSYSKDLFIDDTFNYTFNDKYISYMYQEYKNLKYNFYLITEYKVQSENITNNYLKNVIKSIYKEINNKNIKFIDDSASSDTKFKLIINKSDLAKPQDTILSKANNVIGEGLLINYITNIIIIIIMYNIGNNI